MKRYQVIIVGKGLSALCAGVRLVELGVKDILIVAKGFGGTPAIAAINFVLPDGNANDSPELYAEDMLKAGFNISNHQLVDEMAKKSPEVCEFLIRNGVEFARNADGTFKRRHLSGHSIPRSLCQTSGLIGIQLQEKLTAKLKASGVKFLDGECVRLLSDGKRVYGITVLDRRHFNLINNYYANATIVAWGGVGRLFPHTTYPQDVNGRTLALAYNAGAKLCDLEFVEYEPMVVVQPQGALGEPCPTAMLGEGAHLLNAKGERFVLKKRPQGEAGAPKSLLNRLIWQEVQAGNGSPNGGCYVDLRHIDREVLQGYPWFYNRMLNNGVDPKETLVEVAPMAHSFSGGIAVDSSYRSTLEGLYAVGEAAGGIHGACRCAGNAASQAAISGVICAERLVASGAIFQPPPFVLYPCARRVEIGIYSKFSNLILPLLQKELSPFRTEEGLARALKEVERISQEKAIIQDEDTKDLCITAKLLLTAALNRRESRGTHNRIDYPEMDSAFEYSMGYSKAE